MKYNKQRNTMLEAPVFLGVHLEEKTRNILRHHAKVKRDSLSRFVRVILEEAVVKLEKRKL